MLFGKTCREHGITARLTQPRTPTTTGKVERFHQTLRREPLDETGAYPDLAAAQAAIDVRVRVDQRSVHLLYQGQLVKTVPSNLSTTDLRELRQRGAPPAPPRLDGLASTAVVEVDRPRHRPARPVSNAASPATA